MDTCRKEEDNDYGVALRWTPVGKRKRRWPKTAWQRAVEAERTRAGWRSCNEVTVAVNDRDGLQNCAAGLIWATWHEVDRWRKVNFIVPAFLLYLAAAILIISPIMLSKHHDSNDKTVKKQKQKHKHDICWLKGQGVSPVADYQRCRAMLLH